ncbi:activator of basal transcription 1-like [Diorhabda carinulata]|uniref:activator of basal transcription 1-like n=1 Tax=Diorhabda carinulata TaxID=1163345 RepID=UPI0025A03037|nr:activator of basal transcription 1-like [Diorhabda carinulata]
MTQENSESDQEPSTSIGKVKKPAKRGIIYLSTIPPYMNVTKIRDFFSEFGTVGRIYLQLADKELKYDGKDKTKKKRKVAKKFTEGWVEFEKKSIAKKVAALLNNTQVSNRKKSKQYDHIWNMKYLSNFKWTHLHERLAYEKAARRQKLRAEIQLAKKKSNFFASNIEKTKKNKTVVNKEFENIEDNFEKNSSEEKSKDIEDRKQFLRSLF